MVDDVVAVRRTGPRLEVRRRVHVRDTERREVRHERGRVGEAEAGVKLQPVRRARRHGSRNQPALHGGSTTAPAFAGTSPSVKMRAPSTAYETFAGCPPRFAISASRAPSPKRHATRNAVEL